MKAWWTGTVVVGMLAVALATAGQPPASAQESSEPPLVSQEQFESLAHRALQLGPLGPGRRAGDGESDHAGQARRRRGAGQ